MTGAGIPGQVAPGSTSEATSSHRWRHGRLGRPGGAQGNEILTSSIAAVLTALLAAEGVTVVHMAGLVSVHMFIGMVLIPPVALKLCSTGYRFFRYYTHARAYRALGPPRPLLRVLAPALVASTAGIFVTGVLLLAAGRKSNALLGLHKVSFIVFVVLFGIHFVAYIPRVARSLHQDWRKARREAVPGAGVRAILVALAVGGGAVLAVAVLHAIENWRA